MDIFVFISAIILLLTTTLTVYLLCKHKKIRTLIANIVLHQVKEAGTISGSSGKSNSECTILAYIRIILMILSLIIVTFLHYRKSRFCKGHIFSFQMYKTMYLSNYVKQQEVLYRYYYRYVES